MKKKNKEERKKVIIDLLNDPLYVPMKEKELAVVLQVAKKDREDLHEILDEIVEEGNAELSKRGKYKKPENIALIGTFISHPKGFGFVEIEERPEDLYVPETRVNGAFHGDTVQVALLPGQHGKRQEAEIVKVINHGIKTLVGTYEQSRNFGFVVPDNTKMASDIFVTKERSKGAVSGHKVVVEITDYGKNGKKPEGKVIEILGHIDDPGVDIMSIVRGFDLPVEFGEKVMNQVARIPSHVLESDLEGRIDLRDVQMVTIDGEDAKDLDDAVNVTKDGENYHLGVHIADVSNYVQENSALDREAVERGTSVYLVDRVIPMLPHQLSNGICSLNQGEDRLALSCMMTISPKGEIIDYKIVESVIRVDRRMNYSDVAKILEDKDEAAIEEYKELVPMFQKMEELAMILRRKRKKRGSIDFDFPESKIILDKEGHPIDIKPYDRNVATKIIEDFMLAANETVAQHFYWQEIPFVYRTHDTPDPEKIKKLSMFIGNFGYSLKTTQEEVHPKELQKLLAKIDGTAEEPLISRLTLRSMKQAKYTIESTGHFGLACEYYCHFTSPIRRYPDLQIHRIIKDSLRNRMNANRIEKYKGKLPEVAKHSSEMERRADEAERETDKLKKVEFMEDKIDEIYEGVISGITNWGIYVELPNTIEGMIRVADLPGDYFTYDENAYEMVGQGTGKTYKLGQKITVQVHATDKIARTIDFVVPDEEKE
ncbi:MAG: ribonuclease R [Lachnospiraceae bacterium]|nr:ribonuclease R [Lachnospiraceae bacterium]